MPVVQFTISGKDSGGYVWQNVFHVEQTNVVAAEKDVLKDGLDFINTNIIPAMVAAMSTAVSIYDIGAKILGGAASYTMHKPLSTTGTRMETAYPGPISGKVAIYPTTGAQVGHVYVAGTCEGDYEDDVISPSYNALLQAVADAFVGIDGSDPTYFWQLVIYNKKTSAAIAAAICTALLTATYLSKRARA